ncbi:hypothetical protein [Paracoccus mutanolyticus]|nr:hypothetical protein [Paracoccus mutanolyticus]
MGSWLSVFRCIRIQIAICCDYRYIVSVYAGAAAEWMLRVTRRAYVSGETIRVGGGRK